MFSQTVEYALRAVVYLARHQATGPVDSQRIAEATQVPASYLAKILQDLARTDILSSKRGVGGGFQLAASPEDLSILDVVNAVDPIRRINQCPLSLPAHCETLCPMHARLDESLGQVEKTLRRSTIREMMFDPTRPTPLGEPEPSIPGASAVDSRDPPGTDGDQQPG